MLYIRCAVGEPSVAVKPPVTARRWKTFADVVAFTLGVNVWMSIVILPAAFVGAFHGMRIPAAIFPFAVLVLGLARRSELVLLLLFPAALLVPVIVRPDIAAGHVYGPIRFAIVALGVVAYLFGVSFFTTFHEPPAPRSVRALSSAQQGPAVRWIRRERVYWMLTALSVVIPTTLIAWVNFDSSIEDFLGEMYPGRVALMTTALTVGAIVVCGSSSIIMCSSACCGRIAPATAISSPRWHKRARMPRLGNPAPASTSRSPSRSVRWPRSFSCIEKGDRMRRYFFEILAVALIGGSLFFFKETLDYLARRDYVAALLVMVIGVAVIAVGKEMARLALVQRD